MAWNEQDGMRALEEMQTRASLRNFDDREIPGDLLEQIIKTGLCAASAGNLQPVSIIVVKDKESSARLAEINSKQKFIEQAPVNLLFLIDWYKMGVFAENENAPFNCPTSYMHYMLALEDAMCVAQTIETAAHLCGLGSCYVGTTNYVGDLIAEQFNLPKHTYPIVLLSLGYPKEKPVLRKKLAYDIMVFEEKYPDLTKEYVVEKYREKYGDKTVNLPAAEPYRSGAIDRFRDALLTTYDEEKTDAIMEKVEADGTVNDIQRIFGLHYNAYGLREMGKSIIKKMESMGWAPFDTE